MIANKMINLYKAQSHQQQHLIRRHRYQKRVIVLADRTVMICVPSVSG